ncbi:pirin family protein [Wenjunlia tyrosinilytica]|uniref:Pirin family protein n=1 Tax=Wenjunlia tyrosinilytica TaxID=1544741 RepID=A0A917ZCY5_9ACTN|nr:pirin-like bicupin family protein [Wenjunlia tyrosinilytica]GGO80536.1 hypothetical protein GCM10012280_02680 [Wenjunlia tyrosinilytica]
MAVDVRRGSERLTGGSEGIVSRYAFSFGDHYDPRNIHFGPLIAVNEECLEPGAGFGEHRHRDTEIVTWVVEGELEHRDSAGRGGVVRPGMVQRMSAGGGVTHTERNVGASPVRFVQMWVQPDAFGGDPRYEQRVVDLGRGGLVTVLRLPHATLRAARPRGGEEVELPSAPFVYLHVVRGSLRLDGHELGPGDSARITDAAGERVFVPEGAEFLVWEMRKDLSFG